MTSAAHQSVITAPPGGIATRGAGAITGRIVVRTSPRAGRARVSAGYEGATDRYQVLGSAAGLDHEQIVEILSTDPGPDEYGNPAPARLPSKTSRKKDR